MAEFEKQGLSRKQEDEAQLRVRRRVKVVVFSPVTLLTVLVGEERETMMSSPIAETAEELPLVQPKVLLTSSVVCSVLVMSCIAWSWRGPKSDSISFIDIVCN